MQSQELCYQKQQWEQDFSTRILIQNKHHPAIVSFIRIDLLLPSWRNTVFCDSQTGVERIAPDSGITTVTYPSLSVCVCVCVCVCIRHVYVWMPLQVLAESVPKIFFLLRLNNERNV